MKKEIHARVDSELHQYVKTKSKADNISMSDVLEKMIQHDMKLKNNYVDDLANEIYKRLDDRLKSMRIAINENNKLLKIKQKAFNYLLLAQSLKMPYDEYPDFTHPALVAATEEVKKEIKELQVIKASQRKKAQERRSEVKSFESSV